MGRDLLFCSRPLPVKCTAAFDLHSLLLPSCFLLPLFYRSMSLHCILQRTQHHHVKACNIRHTEPRSIAFGVSIEAQLQQTSPTDNHAMACTAWCIVHCL